jgi:hypothetical protein
MFAEFPLVTFCSDAGNWLFCGRKWIDPADPDGRTLLELHHHNLSILFPAFAAACSRDRFIDAVAGVIESWSRQTAAAAAAGRCPSVVDIPPSSHTATDSDGASPTEELQEHDGAARRLRPARRRAGSRLGLAWRAARAGWVDERLRPPAATAAPAFPAQSADS